MNHLLETHLRSVGFDITKRSLLGKQCDTLVLRDVLDNDAMEELDAELRKRGAVRSSYSMWYLPDPALVTLLLLFNGD